MGGHRRRAARGRRPGRARHRCRRGDHRLRLHRHVDRALSWRRSTASRPRCWKPTRHPGAAPAATAARARTPAAGLALAVDRALGPGRRRSSSTPRSAAASRTSGTWRRRSTATPSTAAISTSRTGPKKLDFLRGRGARDARACSATTRACSRAEEVRRDYCDEREAAGAHARARGHGHPSAQVRLRLMQHGARARREGPHREPGAGLARRSTACTTCRRPAASVRARRVAVCHRRLHRPGAAPAAQEQDHADPVELGGHAPAHDGGAAGHQLQVAHLPHRHAHAALLLPPAAGQPRCRSAAAARSPAPMPPTRAT